MKALVTGASGFIGSHLVESLIKKGFDVTCAVRKTSDLRWIEHLKVDYLYCDLSEIISYSKKLENFDYIFHLAGVTKAPREQDYFFVNKECTERLLRATKDCTTLKRFVFLSSLAAIGPSRNGLPVDEDSPAMPVSAYGRSKLEAENILRGYTGKIPFTIIRPPGVYGPRDKDFLILFKSIKKGILPYWGCGHYSLIYVNDLVQGIIVAAMKDEAVGKTFFISDDKIYTSENIAEEISSTLGRRPVRIRIPRLLLPFLAFISQKIDKKGIINKDRINDFRYTNWTCDPAKAKDVLGFSCITSLQEGVKWTAEWYRIHRWI